MSQLATRRSRPERPPLAVPSQFEALDRTHARVLDMLGQFEVLLQHLDENGPDAVAQASAREIYAFFSEHARQHHVDEEQFVFPPLLAGKDLQLVQHIQRLQQDHGWLEEDWLELAPQIEAVGRGYSWYDLAMLRAALPIFVSLYKDHIALEESLIYPAARQRHQVMSDGAAARTA